MEDLQNLSADKEKSVKDFFLKKPVLFISAYAFYLLVSWLQLMAGDLVLQGSGDFDSVTSYDYVMPAINSVALLLTLGGFILAGFLAYGKDTVKLIRFPVAYCISSVFGAFLSDLFMALGRTVSSYIDFYLVEIHAYIIVALRFVAAVLIFIYLERERQQDYYSYSDQFYVENPSSKTLREKIITHKLCVLWTVLIVCETSASAAAALRSGLSALLMYVPEDLLWLGSYIEVVAAVVYYAIFFVLAFHFSKNFRTTVKFAGIVCFADSIINTVFSVISVYLFTALLAVVKLVIIILICRILRKHQTD